MERPTKSHTDFFFHALGKCPGLKTVTLEYGTQRLPCEWDVVLLNIRAITVPQAPSSQTRAPLAPNPDVYQARHPLVGTKYTTEEWQPYPESADPLNALGQVRGAWLGMGEEHIIPDRRTDPAFNFAEECPGLFKWLMGAPMLLWQRCLIPAWARCECRGADHQNLPLKSPDPLMLAVRSDRPT